MNLVHRILVLKSNKTEQLSLVSGNVGITDIKFASRIKKNVFAPMRVRTLYSVLPPPKKNNNNTK